MDIDVKKARIERLKEIEEELKKHRRIMTRLNNEKKILKEKLGRQ